MTHEEKIRRYLKRLKKGKPYQIPTHIIAQKLGIKRPFTVRDWLRVFHAEGLIDWDTSSKKRPIITRK